MNGFLLALNYPNELSEYISFLLVSTTFAAAILAAPLLLVNIFARRWLTAGQMGLLWGLVLIRLAMPYGFSLESSYSLQNLFIALVQESAPVEPPADAAMEPWRPVGFSSKDAAIQNALNTAFIKPSQISIPELSFTDTLQQYLIFILEWFFLILPSIWFTGAVLILGRMLLTHWRFIQKVNQVPASTDQRLLQLWKTSCQQFHVRRPIPLIVFDEISQPSVMGAIRPKLLLPTDVADLKDEQLQLIMLHELAHIKHRDLAVNWILFGLRLFHWWNPIYWLAATRFHNLREQSRDAMVLRWREQQDENSTQSNHSHEYSELLLTLAQRPNIGSRWRVSLPVSLLGFLKSPFRKRSLANRLKALRRATVKVHPLHTTAVITVIAIFAATGLADIKDLPVSEPIQPLLTSSTTVELQPGISDFGPLFVQVFDVSAPLKKIIEEQKISETQARQWILLTVKTQLGLLNTSHQYQSEQFLESSKPSAKYGEGNQLIVCAPAVWQKELRILLNAWEESGMGQITLEIRFAELSTDIVAKSDIAWNTLETDVAPEFHTKYESLSDLKEPVVQASATVEEYFPVRVAVLTKEQEFQFIQTAQGDERASLMFAPKITFFNGQSGMISNLIYRPYVIGLEKQDDEQLKSKIKIIEEGRSLTLRPVIKANGLEVGLKGLIQLSQIIEVKFITTEVAGKEATIQIPRVHRRRISVASTLKDHQCLLVCIPPTLQEKRFQYVMLKVRILEDPAQVNSSQPGHTVKQSD